MKVVIISPGRITSEGIAAGSLSVGMWVNHRTFRKCGVEKNLMSRHRIEPQSLDRPAIPAELSQQFGRK
jgi:hypothetical protein